MKIIISAFLTLAFALSGRAEPNAPGPSSPPWTKDLVICEIATKGYTSPNGPESGTFKSLAAKVPYLQKLGITGVWLTGHSLSDPKQFYNIWNQYACEDPFKLDPTLGGPEDFKSLITAFHQAGIHVFLDVIAHGVMHDSPLIKQHPDWFSGGSWGMTDYNWGVRNPALDQWWVNGWVDTVRRYGVDGFRVDLGLYRPDLWLQIRRRCAELGHPIVICPEATQLIPGTTDFCQKYLKVSENDAVVTVTSAAHDLAGLIHSNYGNETAALQFKLTLGYADGTTLHFTPGPQFSMLDQRGDGVGRTHAEADGLPDFHFKVTAGRVGQTPASILLESGPDLQWRWPADGVHWVAKVMSAAPDGALEIAASTLDDKFPQGQFGVMDLSCHDNGWEGSALGQNPYVAQGSRCIMGYAALFAPAIPIFMSGEEFDCDYRPLPTLSPRLFGASKPGEGRWLYGSWIDWSQLNQPRQRAMLEDVSRMLAIRKAHPVLAADLISEIPHIAAVPVKGDIASTLPVPYVRWDDKEAIVIVGNPTDKPVQLLLELDTTKLGWNCRQIALKDLWTEGKVVKVPVTGGMVTIPVQLGPDKTPRGGLSVLSLKPVK